MRGRDGREEGERREGKRKRKRETEVWICHNHSSDQGGQNDELRASAERIRASIAFLKHELRPCSLCVYVFTCLFVRERFVYLLIFGSIKCLPCFEHSRGNSPYIDGTQSIPPQIGRAHV